MDSSRQSELVNDRPESSILLKKNVGTNSRQRPRKGVDWKQLNYCFQLFSCNLKDSWHCQNFVLYRSVISSKNNRKLTNPMYFVYPEFPLNRKILKKLVES